MARVSAVARPLRREDGTIIYEAGLAGWTIQAADAAGHVLATAVTDPYGKYCFRGLRPGAYLLGEVMQPGYQQTFPGRPPTHSVQIVAGHNAGSFDFGNQKKPAPCCLSFPFQAGRADNFATTDGAEATAPIPSPCASPVPPVPPPGVPTWGPASLPPACCPAPGTAPTMPAGRPSAWTWPTCPGASTSSPPSRPRASSTLPSRTIPAWTTCGSR